MTTSSRNQTPAEYRATVEAAARTRLDEGKQALEALKERELAESEALNLARIRIQTDQMLAKQAEALRDADQKAQLTAIERRSADLEAVKQARHRLEMEEAAARANLEKKTALEAAAEAAKEKLIALADMEAAAAEQRRTLEIMKVAASQDKALRWQSRWLKFKLMPTWQLGGIALTLGLAAGYLFADAPGTRNHGESVALLANPRVTEEPVYPDTGSGPLVSLRLSRELSTTR